MPHKVPANNHTGFSLGTTVRIVYCAALCICMLLLLPTTGCSTATSENSRVFLSAVMDTHESVFIRRRDLVDSGHYVEHPLLEQWKRHLNGRERNTFPGWSSKENIMRLAGTQSRPAGRHEQLASQGENADAFLNAWNPEPLSMYLLNSDPLRFSFDSVIPLEYPLTNLAHEDFVADEQSRKTAGTVQSLFGGVFNRPRGSEQQYMELVFPVFGISFLMCVLLTPLLCNIGARFISNPIRGSPHQWEAKTTIPDQVQEAMASDITWLDDVLV